MIVDRHCQDFNSVTEDQMEKVGAALALLAQDGAWSRLYLRGGLGAGKTSLVRSILRALGVAGRIKSPSFAVAETYTAAGKSCAHLDLFRQEDPIAWRASGLREIFAEADLLMVEWPEKGAGLPSPDLDISIHWANPDVPEGPRQLRITAATEGLENRLRYALAFLAPRSNASSPSTTPPDASVPSDRSAPISVTRRSLTIVPIAAAVSLGLPKAVRAVEVVAVRVWPAPNYTRVAIEHDTPRLLYATSRLTRPERLVVDIQNLQLGYRLREILAGIQPNDPFISQVRVGQFKPHVVRMVFDLKQASRAQVFTLPPIAQYRHRLVIDLYPEVEADPLLAFLQEYEASRAGGEGSLPTPEAASPPTAMERSTASAPTPLPSAPQSPRRAPSPGANSPQTARPGRPETPRPNFITIAIDAGHGGEDPGAIGRSGTREKDVVLRIARELKRQIDAQPAMRAFLTRDGDFFVPLARRVALARQVNADLFVSVHADAWVSPTAQGASVFALSDKGATSAAARWMANKENESDSIGGVRLGEADDLLTHTLLDMSTTAQIKYSLRLGQSVLREIGRVNRLHKPEVEQAGFAVLRAPDVPSILVETAFISNPEEERRLRDAAYQREVALAIRRGIEDYLAQNPPLAKKTRS
ncbi:MAG: hypothetical protein RLZZ344_346 [Pseudomonadota bacterium]